MPRTKKLENKSSAYRRIQDQARAALVSLRNDIRTMEADLQRLKQEESSLASIAGAAKPSRAAAAPERSRGRIDWREVLSQLPKQFKATDIRSVRGLKNKRPSEIFAAITRWIDSGLVKRKTRGIYERVANPG